MESVVKSGTIENKSRWWLGETSLGDFTVEVQPWSNVAQRPPSPPAARLTDELSVSSRVIVWTPPPLLAQARWTFFFFFFGGTTDMKANSPSSDCGGRGTFEGIIVLDGHEKQK